MGSALVKDAKININCKEWHNKHACTPGAHLTFRGIKNLATDTSPSCTSCLSGLPNILSVRDVWPLRTLSFPTSCACKLLFQTTLLC